VVHMARFAFLREAQIWYDRGNGRNVPWQHFENIIVLSEEFYREVLTHPIPTDREAVKVLSGAPAVLDLFMWLCYRCFVSKGEESIPLFGKYGVLRQIRRG
jgi:Plasmid encoded RepA protein